MKEVKTEICHKVRNGMDTFTVQYSLRDDKANKSVTTYVCKHKQDCNCKHCHFRFLNISFHLLEQKHTAVFMGT